MEHSVENVSPVQRKITVTIPSADAAGAIDKAIRRFGADLTLPGFRKGKVPAKVLEKRFGDEIYARAADALVNDAIAEILDKEKLHPMSRIRFEGDAPQAARDKDFSFAFGFEVLSDDIRLPEDLSALEVEVENAEVTPAELEEITSRVLRSMASLEDVTESRLPQDEDVVLVDIDGEYEGKPVEGMKAENYLMQLHAPKEGEKMSELDALIRTLHAGEEGEAPMVCPDIFPVEDLRGKTIALKCRLHKISREVLPELNDEVAGKAGFPDAEALRKAIADQAANNKIRTVRSAAQQKLLEGLLDSQDFPLPESLVNAYLNEYLAAAHNDMVRRGMDRKSAAGALEGMKEEGMVEARMQAKAQAFLMALGQREGIRVSDMDVDRQIYQMAQESQQDFRKLRETVWQNGMAHDLQGRILAAKALDLMYGKAKKSTLGADGKPLTELKPEVKSEESKEEQAAE